MDSSGSGSDDDSDLSLDLDSHVYGHGHDHGHIPVDDSDEDIHGQGWALAFAFLISYAEDLCSIISNDGNGPEVDLQHSAIWMAGVYLMILMQFLENEVAMKLTRSEFVEAQEALFGMRGWFNRFPTILQACEIIIKTLRKQYAHCEIIRRALRKGLFDSLLMGLTLNRSEMVIV
nr:sister chromatid cohesion protein SCC4-like [Tanacetum cinerariifolium]